jgi:hypothetical protein
MGKDGKKERERIGKQSRCVVISKGNSGIYVIKMLMYNRWVLCYRGCNFSGGGPGSLIQALQTVNFKGSDTAVNYSCMYLPNCLFFFEVSVISERYWANGQFIAIGMWCIRAEILQRDWAGEAEPRDVLPYTYVIYRHNHNKSQVHP